MESKIPLPTDNIYKFYALFGLLLCITSILGSIYVGKATNERIHQLVKEHDVISQTISQEDESASSKVINELLKVETENKKFFIKALGYILGVSIFLMVIGFGMWHYKIQPKQDKYFDLQLRKLEIEVKRLEATKEQA